jgi:hypothetical protein
MDPPRRGQPEGYKKPLIGEISGFKKWRDGRDSNPRPSA